MADVLGCIRRFFRGRKILAHARSHVTLNFRPSLDTLLETRVVPSFTDLGSLGLTGVIISSVAWGDYDADGDLDILLAGRDAGSNRIARVYQNDAGTFTDIAAGLTGVEVGSMAWGDYDADGDLDILLAGFDASNVPTAKVYRNDGSDTFTDISAGLTGVRFSSAAWGDYNSDGDLDILLAGRDAGNTSITRIYRNGGNDTFTDIAAGIVGVSFSSVAWGDYDSDGDLDLVVAGTGAGLIRQSRVYRNDGNGTFTDISAGLTPLNNVSVVWGDCDNDGDLDILIAGQDGGGVPRTKLYSNDGSGGFTELLVGLTGVFYGSVAWGDYDNDGDLDILVTGRDSSSGRRALIYRNNGDDTFTDISTNVTGMDLSSVAWGDYDNDGDLDILVTGRDSSSNFIAKVYGNNTTTANNPPAAPTGLSAVSNTGTSITFSWTAATDTQTPSAGLSYNLRVGTTPGGSDVFSTMANASTGQRRIPDAGPIQGTSCTLSGLTPGVTYYWSVQAIDTALAGGAFAGEESLHINAVPVAQASNVTTDEDTAYTFAVSDFLFNDVEGDDLVSITVSSLSLPTGDTLTVDQGSGPVAVTNGLTIAAAEIATLTYTPAGNANGAARSTFAFTVNDADSGTTSATMTINVTAVNDPPILEVYNPKTYTEGSAPIFITPGASVSDLDSSDFDGGSLTITRTGGLATDRLTVGPTGGPLPVAVDGENVSVGSTVIGTVAGGDGTNPLVISLNAAATPDLVHRLVRSIRYHNVSTDPTDGGSRPTRTVTFSLADGDGGSASDDKVLTLVDAPDLGGVTSPVEFIEEAGPIRLAPVGTVADFDSPDLAGGKLTVQYVFGATGDDRLTIRDQGTSSGAVGFSSGTVTFEGVPVATATGGLGANQLVVTFNADATPAIAEAVLRNITFENLSRSNLSPTRVLRFTLSDGDGGTSVPADLTVGLTGVADSPVVSLSGTSRYTENGAPVVVAPLAGLVDVDSPTLSGGSLTVTLTAGGLATDQLAVADSGTGPGQVGVSGEIVTYAGVDIGTVSGGTGTDPLVVTFNAAATVTAVRAVMRAVTYANTSDNPTAFGAQPTRTIQFVVDDGAGGVGTGSKSIAVKAVNDQPMVSGIAATIDYTAGSGATALAASATVTDPDSADLAFGTLTVRASVNSTSSDRFEIQHEGTGSGEVGVGGGEVSYGGLVIGTVTGGVGTTRLVVTFNEFSTAEAVQAVLRKLTYRNTNPVPIVTTRTIRILLSDGDGGLVVPIDQVLTIV